MEVKNIITLNDKEKEAIEIVNKIDCSDINRCIDCPFMTDRYVIFKHYSDGTYDKEVESFCILLLIQTLLFKIND